MSQPRTEFIQGFQATLPFLFGVLPFGMISGVAAFEIGLSPSLAMGMSLIMFAGTAQLATVQLINVAAPVLVIILTALVINLRFLMYSASIAPHLQHLSVKWKGLIAYLLTDQAYAVSIAYFQPQNQHQHWFLLGAEIAIALTWHIGTALGIFLGAKIPSNLSFDFIIPLAFMTLVFPAIKDRPTAIAALCAGFTALITINLPFNLGLIIAALVGIIVGLFFEANQ